VTNRPFGLALATDALAWVAIAVVEGAFAYFLIYWGGIPEEDSPIVMAVILASATLFLPFVNWLSNRFEKKWAYVISTATWMAAHLGLWFVPQFMMTPVYIVAVVAGLGVASAHVLPGAMSIDVLESVELDSGQRQEGVFTGTSNFFRKLGISVALFALGWMLEWTGYVPNAAAQSARALTGIRVMMTWVPLALLGLAIMAAVAFPITREIHARMVAELEARRAS
jgi:GPH family glycoside/pentoside/hexuronide:cation symporter